MNFVPYAIPFFILAILAEFVYAKVTGRYTYRLNDTLSSLTMGTVSRLMGIIRVGLTAFLVEWLLRGYTLLEIGMDSIPAWVAAFVLYDLCYYFAHRFGHEWRILWAAHVAHHQSEEFNLSTALRQTSTGYLTAVFYLPLYLIGFPAEMIISVGSINLIYQFWVHTEHVRRIGFLEYVLITPSNHRVHHAKNPCYIDRNYGGVFILWDRMFGTFADEREDEPCVYGVTEQLNSFDPIRANLHVYAQGVRDTLAANRWQDKLLLWFKGPGFKPAGTDQTPHEWRAPKFDPVVSAPLKTYAFIHFWLLVVTTFVVLGFEQDLPRLEVYLFAALCLAGFCALAALLENRTEAMALELARLTGTAVAAVISLWTATPFWTGLICGVTGVSVIALLRLKRLAPSEKTQLPVVTNDTREVETERG